MKSVQNIFGVAAVAVAVLVGSVFVANKNTNSEIAKLNERVDSELDKSRKTLDWIGRDVRDLRFLVMENQERVQREIESIKNVMSISDMMQSSSSTSQSSQSIRDSESAKRNLASDEVLEEVSRKKRREEVKSKMMEELKMFESILTDEQRAEWDRRVNEKVNFISEESMKNVPEELRNSVLPQAQSAMAEMRETMKYAVLKSMLAEMQLRESWEEMKRQNPDALKEMQDRIEMLNQ